MEYLEALVYIIQPNAQETSILKYIDQVITIVNSLLTLVVIIIGFNWLKPLKEKQNAAAFTFWSQLRIRLIKVNSYLQADKQCLYYLYSLEARITWGDGLAPNPSSFVKLKETIEETLSFLQHANDQMPPYPGWTHDYESLLHYLVDMITFDICDTGKKFKFTDPIEYSKFLSYRDSICTLINSICEKIKDKQESIEKKLTIPWYQRILKH